MKSIWIKIAISLVLVAGVVSCRDAGANNQQSPHSSGGEIERLFANTGIETVRAIKSAFSNLRYHSAMLESVSYYESASVWNTTNSFRLSTTTQPLAQVTLHQKQVPYFADFHIDIIPVTTNQTKVTVRTLRANVIVGKKPNIHGGWANRYEEIPPIQQEEKNILDAIVKQLAEDKGL